MAKMQINSDMLPFNDYIQETGSNGYGSWIKYKNGIMITARTTNTISVDITSAWGNLYVGKINDYYRFPQYFIEAPTVIYDIIPAASLGCFTAKYNAPIITNEKIDELWVARPNSTTGVLVKVNIIAIGRWK